MSYGPLFGTYNQKQSSLINHQQPFHPSSSSSSSSSSSASSTSTFYNNGLAEPFIQQNPLHMSNPNNNHFGPIAPISSTMAASSSTPVVPSAAAAAAATVSPSGPPTTTTPSSTMALRNYHYSYPQDSPSYPRTAYTSYSGQQIQNHTQHQSYPNYQHSHPSIHNYSRSVGSSTHFSSFPYSTGPPQQPPQPLQLQQSQQPRCLSSGSSDGELDLSKPSMRLLKSSLAFCGLNDIDDDSQNELSKVSVPGTTPCSSLGTSNNYSENTQFNSTTANNNINNNNHNVVSVTALGGAAVGTAASFFPSSLSISRSENNITNSLCQHPGNTADNFKKHTEAPTRRFTSLVAPTHSLPRPQAVAVTTPLQTPPDVAATTTAATTPNVSPALSPNFNLANTTTAVSPSTTNTSTPQHNNSDECNCTCHYDEAEFRLQLYMTATAGADAGYFYSRLPFRPYFDLTTPLQDYIYRDEHVANACLASNGIKCCDRANTSEPSPKQHQQQSSTDGELIDTCLVSGGQMPEKLSFETKNVVAWFRKMKRAVFSQEKYGGLTKEQLFRFLLKSVKHELRDYVTKTLMCDNVDWTDPILWSQYLLEITYDRFKLRSDLRSLVLDLHKTPTNDMECRRYARLHADYQAYYSTPEGYYNILLSNFDTVATAKVEGDLKNYLAKNRLKASVTLEEIKTVLNDAIIKLYAPKMAVATSPGSLEQPEDEQEQQSMVVVAKAPPTPPTPTMSLSKPEGNNGSTAGNGKKRLIAKPTGDFPPLPDVPMTPIKGSSVVGSPVPTTPFTGRFLKQQLKTSKSDEAFSPAQSPVSGNFFNIEMGQLSQVTLAESNSGGSNNRKAFKPDVLSYAAVAASTKTKAGFPLTPCKISSSMGSGAIEDSDDDDDGEEEDEEGGNLLEHVGAAATLTSGATGSIGSERKAGLLRGGSFSGGDGAKPVSLAPLPLGFIGSSPSSPSARRHHSMSLGKIGDEGVPTIRRASFTEEILSGGCGVGNNGSATSSTTTLMARAPPSEKTWTSARFMAETNRLFCTVEGVPVRTHVAFRHPQRLKKGQSIITREESAYRSKHGLCIKCGNHLAGGEQGNGEASEAKCVRHPYYYIYFNWEL